MKYYYFLFALISSVVLPQQMFAQCSVCSPDPACISPDGFPALCPMEPAPGTTGVFYEEFLTFYLPELVTDPTSGIEATVLSVEITSVTGLPYGLVFNLNDADNIYYPADGDNLGCATICGTPLIPGVYSANIAVTALVNALGFTLTRNENFIYTIEIVAGDASANSFSYSTPAGCGEVEVEFVATTELPPPSVITYNWDFGNNSGSSAMNPGPVTYSEPGTYIVSLTTTISDYSFNSFGLFSISDLGSNDLDDILNESDPYFILVNGNGETVFTSTTVDNSTSASWTGMQIMLSNPPYSIMVYDEDPITEDDLIGTLSVEIVNGETLLNAGNGTTGQATVSLITTGQLTDGAEITVFPLPETTLSISDPLLSVPFAEGNTYLWYRNGALLTGENSSQIELTQGGMYYCTVTNEYGCSAQSSTHIHCPVITPEYDALAMELSVEQGFNSYQWYFNGVPQQGANSFYFVVSESGNYSVLIQTNYGCTVQSDVFVLNLSDNSLPSENGLVQVFPSPFSEFIDIRTADSVKEKLQINIFDVGGRIVYSGKTEGNNTRIPAASLSPGFYIAEITGRNFRTGVRILKQ